LIWLYVIIVLGGGNMDNRVILFDISFCEDIGAPLLTITPLSYFEDYDCLADFVDEDVFDVLDKLGFGELSESLFEYIDPGVSIRKLENILFNCDDFAFEKSEEFSKFLKGEGEEE